MNYKNFEGSALRESEKETVQKQETFTDEMSENENCFCSDHDDVLAALENEFETFAEIVEILARQEYRKRKFYGFLKKAAALVFFPVFIFSGIIIFAKKCKTGKDEKSKKFQKQ